MIYRNNGLFQAHRLNNSKLNVFFCIHIPVKSQNYNNLITFFKVFFN